MTKTKQNVVNDGLISRKQAYEVLTKYYHQRTEIQHKALKEALERVPTCNHITSDIISRQVAIDMFQRLSYEDWNKGLITWSEAWRVCAEIIRDLPSAQSALVGDLIDRKKAIEVVHDYFLSELNKEETEDVVGVEIYKNMSVVNRLLHHNKAISERIKALPSAQTEIDDPSHPFADDVMMGT